MNSYYSIQNSQTNQNYHNNHEKTFKRIIALLALIICSIVSFAIAPILFASCSTIRSTHRLEAHAETGYVETDAWATNKVYYDSTRRMYTTWFHIDGHLAYCCQPANGTPKSSSYWKNYFYNRTAAAILYFGYGGPGWNYARDNGYWPSHNADGGAMSDGDYYVATHVLISWAYGSDYKHGMSPRYRQFTDNNLTSWVLDNLKNNAWRVPEKFVNNVYSMDPGSNTKNGLLGQDIVSYNWVDAGGIQLNKKEAKTNRNMSDISFGIYNSNQNGDWGSKVATIKTDGSGNASTRENELPTGWYRLREENPPSGYKAVTSDAIQVTDNYSYAHNTAKNGKITGSKNSDRIQLYNTATVNVSVTKTWLGKDVPKNTKVTLKRNGKEYITLTIDKNTGSNSNDNNWNYTWKELPKYDDSGIAYKYSVVETDEKNGVITIDGNNYSVTYKTAGNTTTITNTEVKNITVDKKWVDSNNKYGTRPTSISVTLQRYDSSTRKSSNVETVTLSDANSWHYEWSNLKTVNDNNSEYSYAVTENTPSPANTLYSASRADTSVDKIVFVNTLKLRDITVNKEWVGTKAKPSGIVVKLKDASGTIIRTSTITPDASGKWSCTFTGVPTYNASGAIEDYSIEEEPVSGYKSVVSGNANDGFTIKNVSTEKISIPLIKQWVNTTGHTDTKPSAVTIELYRNGKPTNVTVDLKASNNWVGSFDNLDKYDSNGDLIKYTVAERSIEGYSWKVTGDQNAGFTITNTYGVTTVTINKYWNNTGKTTSDAIEVTFRIYADGVDQKWLLRFRSDGSPRQISIPNLPKYNSSGAEINYTIQEDSGALYTPTIVREAGTNTFNVTNTYSEDKTNVSLNKTWDDNNDEAGLRPNKVSFQLYKIIHNENSSELQARYKDSNGNSTAPTVLKKDNYNVTDKRILIRAVDRNKNYSALANTGESLIGYAKDYVYSISPQTSIKSDSNGIYDVDLTGQYNIFVFGNYTNFAIGLGDNPKVLYQGDDGSSDPTAQRYNGLAYLRDREYDDTSFHYIYIFPTVLYINGTDATLGFEYSFTEEDGEYMNGKERSTSSTNKFPTSLNVVSELGKWSWAQNNIKKITATGIATKDSNGNSAHRVSITNDSGIKYLVGNGGSKVSFIYTSDSDKTVNIYRTMDDNEISEKDDTDYYAPSQEKLLNNETKVASFKASAGTHVYKININSNGPEYSTDVPTALLSQFYVFKDNNNNILNNNVTRFATYSLGDYNNYEALQTINLTKDNNWTLSINDLPRFSDNNALNEYYFSENCPNNYTAKITDNTGRTGNYHPVDSSGMTGGGTNSTGTIFDSFTSTAVNTVGDLIDIPVDKVWEDNDNALGYRPNSITVSLYNLTDNVDTGKKIELTASNDWKGIIKNVPYRNANNEVIKYTLREASVPDHYSSTLPENDGGLHSDGSISITNILPTIDIPVTKTWDDGNNETGKRPSQVIMKLYYTDGSTKVDTGKRLLLNDANNWSSSFTSLPYIKTGSTPYKYTVEEDQVDGYTSSSSWKTLSNGSRSYTFTNKLSTRDISIKKVWKVSSQDRAEIPSSIVVTLYADGTRTRTIELNESNNWTYVVTGLPFLNDSGTKINYTIQESMLAADRAKYVTSVSGNASDGFVITNSRKINIPVTKVWNDDNDHDGVRPDNVSVFLVKNGVNTGKAVLLDESNNWTDSFKDLDAVDDDGNDIVYGVEEEYVNGYSKTISGDVTNGFTITNTHEKTTTDLKITKGWDDQQNIDKKRPNSVNVTIYRDGTTYKSVTLTEANNWETTLKNVPKTNTSTGRDIVYTAKESNVDSYELSDNELTGNAEDGWTISLINHHEPEHMNIPVRKRWYNTDGQTLPSDITVTLLQDGKEYLSIKMTSANAVNGEWIGEFTNVPIYKPNSTDKYEYSVREASINGSTSYSCQVAGDTEHGFVLTNIYTKASTQVVGVKQWVGDTSDDRPASITVRLLRDDVEIASQVVKAQTGDTWRFTFADLPVTNENGDFYNYEVVEDPVPGYNVEYGFLPNSETYRITNRKTLNIPVKKEWDDNNNANGSRPNSVTARLYAYRYTNAASLMVGSDGYYPFTASASGNEFTGTLVCDGSVQTATINVCDANNNRLSRWTVAINGDTSSHSFSLGKISDPNAKIIVYTDKGENASSHISSFTVHDTMRTREELGSCELNSNNNWETTFNDQPATDNKGFPLEYFVEEDPIYGYTSSITGNVNDGFTITNTEQTEIKVTKKWLTANGLVTKNTPGSTIVTLLQNGKEYQSLTLKSSDGYTGAFTNIPWRDANGNEYKYDVTEGRIHGWQLLDVSGDTTDGFIVTNGMTTTVDVQKEWDGDTEAKRPTSINASLIRNVTLPGNYSSGNMNTLEGVVNDYAERLSSETAEHGTPASIEATIHAENLNSVTSVHVQLVDDSNNVLWDKRQELNNGDNVFDISTANVKNGTKNLRVIIDNISESDTTISDLYASGWLSVSFESKWSEIAENITLTSSDSWWYSNSSLPLVDMNGAVFDYEVCEDNIPTGYSATYTSQKSGEQSVTLTIKNSYSKINVPVKKIWNDQNNADGTRPDSVTVELLKNGRATGTTLVLNDANGWAGSFDELDAKTGNITNTYTVRENDVPTGYTSNVLGNQTDGFTVTNTHAGKTSITVTKKWDDQNNAGRKRPSSVTVHLFANGTEVASKIIEDDGNGNWEASFDNLDYATDNGQVIKYTVSETSVTGYNLQGITGSQDDGYTITNWTSSPIKLPETGLSGLLAFILLSVSTALAAFISRRKAVREQKD